MACHEPLILIENLVTCNASDNSLNTANGGVVVVDKTSSDFAATPGDAAPPADGHVLSYQSGNSPPVAWVSQSGGGGGSFTYQAVTTTAAITAADGLDVVSLEIAGLGVAAHAAALNNGTVSGQRVVVVLKTIAAGASYTLTPASFLNGTAITVDTAGQGVQLVWLADAWALVPGGATVS